VDEREEDGEEGMSNYKRVTEITRRLVEMKEHDNRLNRGLLA